MNCSDCNVVICRASGELVGPWLVRIVPQLIRFLGASNQDASEEHPQVFTELKENCLQVSNNEQP